MRLWKQILIAAVGTTSACQPTGSTFDNYVDIGPDPCNASKYAQYVNGLVSVTLNLGIPDNSRYFGHTIDTQNLTGVLIDYSRLNFITSADSAVDAVTNPDTTIVRIFCG